MDTAGKAVLFSGVTVLISLSAVMLVPSPAFRSMALGIMLAVVFVLAATLTLLPAVLAKLGPRVDTLALPLGARAASTARRASPRWGERLWRRPARLRRRSRSSSCVALALPVARPADRHAVDQGRPDRRQPRASATRRSQQRLRPRRARAPCRSSRPAAERAQAPRRRSGPTRASPRVMPPQPGRRRRSR